MQKDSIGLLHGGGHRHGSSSRSRGHAGETISMASGVPGPHSAKQGCAHSHTQSHQRIGDNQHLFARFARP